MRLTRSFLSRSVNIIRQTINLFGLLSLRDYVIMRFFRYAQLVNKNNSAIERQFGVNILGYFNGEFGVGEVARGSAQALISQKIPTSLNNMKATMHRSKDPLISHFSLENPYYINLIHVNADQVPTVIAKKGVNYFKNRYNIGYWFWELPLFPSNWNYSFAALNEIWVASDFCMNSMTAISPVPVVKMPLPILLDKNLEQINRQLLRLPEGKLLFGFVFDYLSVEERKNPIALIEAFKEAFNEHDDVVLIIKTINEALAPEKSNRLRKAANGFNIQFINEHLSRNQMICLMASLDCYVSLHRSEGFGIGMAQAMWLGKPVIATGYSGNMEFMNDKNSLPVHYNLVELSRNYGPYKKGNYWAEPDVSHAAELMRWVYNNPQSTNQLGIAASRDVKRIFNLSNTGRRMRERLNELPPP